ncbi:hypothetical protein K1T71_011542 [Dendrolimus kikuchii]|uniref:Uncharacterized protein n=1 Tax=Dendrolimus kikuchii TaxID=765133 RepID=A0ACC1CPB1_9NEOP|nr:hypothetical protein K1T71_011542 [Dendrolimus kikuchii]
MSLVTQVFVVFAFLAIAECTILPIALGLSRLVTNTLEDLSGARPGYGVEGGYYPGRIYPGGAYGMGGYPLVR